MPWKSGRWRDISIGYAKGIPAIKEPVDKLLTILGVPVSALFSTLGRTAARGLEAQWRPALMKHFQDKMVGQYQSRVI